MNTSVHRSVMPDEVVAALASLNPNVIVDGTFGGGGHSRLLLDLLPPKHDTACIIGMDRDPEVFRRNEHSPPDPRIHVFLGSYEAAPRALEQLGFSNADALVLDLGLSSDQLASDRGFSFNNAGDLDLRFDPETGIPAWQWLQRHDEKAIADAIYQFGEERFSRRIAAEVIRRARAGNAVRSVADMVDICRRCVPRSKNHDIHPATRTFQALRIAVNEELEILRRSLMSAPEWIRPGGRVVAISFHSLEDRIVKQAFRDDPRYQMITKKPLRPTPAEVRTNPRSRSAKLRIAEVIGSAAGRVRG
ncbi:MAG: 16S rRNA (cytosine(1402)-N(4))-methyltransferase RsmH [Planctomycetota bacterium]